MIKHLEIIPNPLLVGLARAIKPSLYKEPYGVVWDTAVRWARDPSVSDLPAPKHVEFLNILQYTVAQKLRELRGIEHVHLLPDADLAAAMVQARPHIHIKLPNDLDYALDLVQRALDRYKKVHLLGYNFWDAAHFDFLRIVAEKARRVHTPPPTRLLNYQDKLNIDRLYSLVLGHPKHDRWLPVEVVSVLKDNCRPDTSSIDRARAIVHNLRRVEPSAVSRHLDKSELREYEVLYSRAVKLVR